MRFTTTIITLLYIIGCLAYVERLETIEEFHRRQDAESLRSRNWKDPYNGLPIMRGTLFPNQGSIQWSAGCFQNYTATMTGDSRGGVITINAQNAIDFYCTDLFLILDMQNWYAKDIYMHGNYQVEVSWKPQEWEEVLQNGFQIFEIGPGIMGEIVDLYEFYSLMTSQSDPEYVMQFLTKRSGWDFIPRTSGFINLNKSEVMSGDYIAVMELDGDSLLITYGTGSRTDHAAMALWIDSELYVIESCTKGIRKTPWDEWMDNRPDWSMIGLLRLRPDLLEKFNSTAAFEFFSQLEGNEYGWQNFIFGWIDTPNLNFPPPLLSQNVPIGLALVERMAPSVTKKMILEGFNLRLGTTDLGILQLENVLNSRNMTWGQLWSIPESDNFKYPSRNSPSLVCSSFVMATYRAAGIFPEISFEATEITPKDSYQLEIFDAEWNRPKACRTDDLPYCQLNGGWRLNLDGFNTVPMISHVDEKCGAMPPLYVRTPTVC